MLPTVLVAAAAILGVVQATWSGSSKSDDSLCYKPYYNAPKAPWEKGCSPGWFEGSNKPSQGSYHGKPWSQIPSWDGGDKNLCDNNRYSWLPQCKKSHGSKPTKSSSSSAPKPTQSPCGDDDSCVDGYYTVFDNYTTIAPTGVYTGQRVGAATIDNENYLTYGLADDVAGCLDVCDSVAGCTFVNVYQDQNQTLKNAGPIGQEKLTCALFSACSGTDKLTNYGGQDDPTLIVDSRGYCKDASRCQS